MKAMTTIQTFETARTEAIRRTKASGTTHYIVDAGVRVGYVVRDLPFRNSDAIIQVVTPDDIEQMEHN